MYCYLKTERNNIMKHNQQMIDAFVRIRAAGASHIDIAKQLGISKNTSCEWSHLHAEAIEETIKENREDARFYENFQRAEELVNVNKIIKNFLFRIENDRYGFGHTMNYKDTCRMLGVMVKHREYLFKRNGDNPIAVRAIPGHPAKRPSPAAAAQPPQPSNPGSDEKNHVPATGTIGTAIPIVENEPTPQNPNKTNSSIEKQPETIPQKNAHPIPVPAPMERRFATGEALPHQFKVFDNSTRTAAYLPLRQIQSGAPIPAPNPGTFRRAVPRLREHAALQQIRKRRTQPIKFQQRINT